MSQSKSVVILAGGKGTRLKSVLDNKPKPLAEVGGQTLIERQIDLAVEFGVTEIHLLVQHLAEQIREQVGSGERWGISIQYHRENEPLGTAGCVLDALDKLPERFFVFYADTLMRINLDRLWQHHIDRKADATLLIHPNDHPSDSDLIEVDDEDWVTKFHSVPHPEHAYLANLVNAALYVVEKSAIEPWSEKIKIEKMDFARNLFPDMVTKGAGILGYRSREYIKDMGTPTRITEGERDLATGKLARLEFNNSAPAVFLDRDGTLNVEVDRVSDPSDLVLIDGAAEACRALNKAGVLAVVATNQAVIARGDCTFDELKTIHNRLETLLGKCGAYIDSIYFCPHHPHSGYEGEVSQLKIECDCRKPAGGMLLSAASDMNIDLNRSWMIGDTTRDVGAAHSAGVRSVLVRTGHAGCDYTYPVRADFEFYDLRESVSFILDDFERLTEMAGKLLPEVSGRTVVLVGGRSRAGKSTWASVCRNYYHVRGKTAHIVCMDGWLRPLSNRGDTVRERFDTGTFTRTVCEIARSEENTTLKLPAYDRQSRTTLADKGPELDIKPSDILIVDGVLALDIPELRELSDCSFFVSCAQATYEERIAKEYRLRGYDDEQLRSLMLDREKDEIPVVDNTAQFADHVVNLVAETN